jgi:pimeloyl-ACP methyl ester carboxylesterase
MAPASAGARGIVELPVAFQVANTNTSAVACPSDGATYTIRGHISGPRAALAHRRANTIAVYLYGMEGGEWNWDFKPIRAYDYPAKIAREGHVSLTLDELGYGAGDHPGSGEETCQGAYADIAHQIIERLRKGEDMLGSEPGIAFSKVVLVGHDVGGQVAEIEAYSYFDIDGLILVTRSARGGVASVTLTSCAAGSWRTTLATWMV